jgi:hypothetical protein
MEDKKHSMEGLNLKDKTIAILSMIGFILCWGIIMYCIVIQEHKKIADVVGTISVICFAFMLVFSLTYGMDVKED